MVRWHASTPAFRRKKPFLFIVAFILLSAAMVLAACQSGPDGSHQTGGGAPAPEDGGGPEAGSGDGTPPGTGGGEDPGGGEAGSDEPRDADDDDGPDDGQGGGGGGDSGGDGEAGHDAGGDGSEGGGAGDGGPGESPEHPGFALEEIVGGFTRPLYLTHAGDGSGRLFILEQGGRISIWDGERLLDEPFLDISALVTTRGNEQGLLSLAFAPDYADSGEAYVSYSGSGGRSVIARYAVDPGNPNRLDPDSAEVIFQLDQPYSNHNGGLIKFGPDGYLYFGLGDGGSGGDPLGSGQDLTTLLGAMLRIDVTPAAPAAGGAGSGDDSPGSGGGSGHGGPGGGTGTASAGNYRIPPDNPYVNSGPPGAKHEIWAYGLRNPWRFSFDRETGDLYIADVGQNEIEEINFQPAHSPGGENYGWNTWEGSRRYSRSDTEGPGPVVFPILEYSHTGSNCSVTGGYVYRGRSIPALRGVYIYGDYCSGLIWGAKPADGDGGSAGSGPEAVPGWVTADLFSSGLMISSFGEDEDGELYVFDHREGGIYRLVPGAEPVPEALK